MDGYKARREFASVEWLSAMSVTLFLPGSFHHVLNSSFWLLLAHTLAQERHLELATLEKHLATLMGRTGVEMGKIPRSFMLKV